MTTGASLQSMTSKWNSKLFFAGKMAFGMGTYRQQTTCFYLCLPRRGNSIGTQNHHNVCNCVLELKCCVKFQTLDCKLQLLRRKCNCVSYNAMRMAGFGEKKVGQTHTHVFESLSQQLQLTLELTLNLFHSDSLAHTQRLLFKKDIICRLSFS